jgi:flagellar basal-body rod modification protein FlgD
MDVTALNATSSSAGTSSTKNAADIQDRFLKLLVAQMKNQDPMNPTDNAQITSQMAQIQTVSGISGLDKSIQSLGTQFSQMQALQGVALVGHDVTVAGNKLYIKDNVATGGYELDGPADKVKLEVLSPAGTVIDTYDLGAQSTGMQRFTWPADKAAGYAEVNFRITANSGTATVAATTYMTDTVSSINTSGGTLQLQLANMGLVDYSAVKSVD